MKILLTTILVIFIFTGCNESNANTAVAKSSKTKNNMEEKTSIIKEVVDNSIVLKDIAGETIKVMPQENGFIFEGYEDKIVLVNFFKTWCRPCIAEIPHLNNLQEKYKNDLKIISVLLEKDKTNQDMKDFIEKNNIQFTVTNTEDNHKLASEVGGVEVIPLMLIYDRVGNYSQHYIGAVPEEMIEADIKKVL